jgi:outer membrane protein assembly factor BamB
MSRRTSLAVAGSEVYTLDRRLSALEASTGRIRWQRPAPPASRPGLLVADAAVVCAACESLFAVYRARDGAALWQLDRRDGNGPFLGMVLMGETVYLSRGVATPRGGFALEARDAMLGTLRWTWPAPTVLEQGQEQEELLARIDLSWRFVGGGGMLYVPGARTLCGVRASDGALLWHQPIASSFPALVAIGA